MSAAAGLALIVAATAALLFLLAAASAAVLLLLVLISALVVHRKLLSIPLAAGTEVTNWKNELSVPQRTIAPNRAGLAPERKGAIAGARWALTLPQKNTRGEGHGICGPGRGGAARRAQSAHRTGRLQAAGFKRSRDCGQGCAVAQQPAGLGGDAAGGADRGDGTLARRGARARGGDRRDRRGRYRRLPHQLSPGLHHHGQY